ncbi:hypothetical protein LOK49_LG14G01230 [Camellia lanceoleosa]|uniref:Uncharacterized protein n=1 Tax=Camellia lanceoleosa TaxID=1840588 RepID=A0ACC0FE29_9ERIC|nr:hypothetical protein LOK49_LG14G01230 [Camellia lanceoleosa]
MPVEKLSANRLKARGGKPLDLFKTLEVRTDEKKCREHPHDRASSGPVHNSVVFRTWERSISPRRNRLVARRSEAFDPTIVGDRLTQCETHGACETNESNGGRPENVKSILGLSEAENWPTIPMSSMDLLIWNFKGVGNDRFWRNLRDLVQMHKPDMVILMETKVELNKMGMFFNNLGYIASTHLDPIVRSGGIWLLWNPNQVNVLVNEACSQMMTATISRQEYLDWVLSAIYASPNTWMRDELWNGLETIAQNIQEPWLVAGNFNDYSSSTEKRSFSVNQSQSPSQSQRMS